MAKHNSSKGEEEIIEDHNMEAISLVKQTYTENFYSTFMIPIFELHQEGTLKFYPVQPLLF